MKKTVVVLSIMLMLSFCMVQTTVQGAWWDTDWSYYKILSLGSTSDGYQLVLNVTKNGAGDVSCDGHCRDDFGDIRFVDTDNSTLYDYWLQNYTSGKYAVFWIETGTDSDILMYYGNSSAVTTSNGTNTFEWFDDFEDGDVTDWTDDANCDVYADNTEQAHGSYCLHFDQTSGAAIGWAYKAMDLSSMTVGYWAKMDDCTTIHYIRLCSDTDSANVALTTAFRIDGDEVYEHRPGGSAWLVMNGVVDDTYYHYEFRNVDEVTRTYDSYVDWSNTHTNSGFRNNVNCEYFFVGGNNAYASNNMYVDSIYVRQYDSTPPVWSSFSPEHSAPPPAANNPPVISNPDVFHGPTNTTFDLNATGVYTGCTQFNFTLSDLDGDSMNITLSTNESGGWQIFNQTTGLTNGTYYFYNTSWIDTMGTTYWIWCNVTDGGNWTNKSYHFTTMNPPSEEGFDDWALVSIPYNATISKFNVHCIYGGSEKTWNESVSAGWILNILYNYTGGMYHWTDFFEAYMGYWMYWFENIELYYPPVDNVSVGNVTYNITYNITYTNYTGNITGGGGSPASKGLFAGGLILGTATLGIVFIKRKRNGNKNL